MCGLCFGVVEEGKKRGVCLAGGVGHVDVSRALKLRLIFAA